MDSETKKNKSEAKNPSLAVATGTGCIEHQKFVEGVPED